MKSDFLCAVFIKSRAFFISLDNAADDHKHFEEEWTRGGGAHYGVISS